MNTSQQQPHVLAQSRSLSKQERSLVLAMGVKKQLLQEAFKASDDNKTPKTLSVMQRGGPKFM